jgi:hypothetical protein
MAATVDINPCGRVGEGKIAIRPSRKRWWREKTRTWRGVPRRASESPPTATSLTAGAKNRVGGLHKKGTACELRG